MADNQAEIDRALNAIGDAQNETTPDYTWADALPEAPPMPVAADDALAIGVPAGGKP